MTHENNTFDNLLDRTLRTRSAAASPRGMEQRLMAAVHNESVAPALFNTAMRVQTSRSSGSFWGAMAAHAAVIALIAVLAMQHVSLAAPAVKTVLTALDVPAPPPPIAPKAETIGGGGGQHDLTPPTQGHLPKFTQEQLNPPKVAVEDAKLTPPPDVLMQKDLKMADNKMPDLGLPNSSLKGPFSGGTGSGSGLGSGNGGGIGPGSGGNTGGGVYHVGGAVAAPKVIYSVEPEFSEEARKAKFSGNVQVYLWVDEQGNPSHVKVFHGVGMGLDEKAIEAVRQYKFKPAMKDGKPVKVDLYIDVNFQIF